jgi:hypothetical protein
MRLTGLFGDQAANASAAPIAGSMTATNNINATTITGISTFVKANFASTVAGAKLNGYTHTPNNRLTYIGVSTIKVTISVVASLRVASVTDKNLRIILARNGIDPTLDPPMHPSGISCTVQGVNSNKVIAIAFTLELATNDYIELWVTNDSSTDNVIIEDMNMVIE